MKSFIVFTALVALAVANPLHKPSHVLDDQYQEIINAINSPSTDPATAEKLWEMLAELTGANQIDISPVLVADDAEPPFAGHEIADVPVVAPATPLVQIIVNVKAPGAVASPVPAPVEGDNASDDADDSPVAIPETPVAVLPPPVTGVIVADSLPPPPVTGVIVADNLPAPPALGVVVADNLPAPPALGVVVADDLPAPPSLGVVVAEDLPAPPALGVVVAEDIPAPPALGVVVADL